jgi:hypothetical protein
MDILDKVRESILTMWKYKQSIHTFEDMHVFVSEDVYEELKKTANMTHDITGRYYLDGIEVTELKDYPKGYIAVE